MTIPSQRDLSFHESIKTCNIDNIQDVLAKDTSVINSLEPKTGWPALYKCVVYDHREIAEFLLQTGADVNVTNRIGETPLNYAVETGSLDFVKLLLKYGANPCFKQSDGDSVLHVACKRGDLQILKELLDVRADKSNINLQNKFGKTPLHLAGEFANKEMFELLLLKGSDYNIADKFKRKPRDAWGLIEKLELGELNYSSSILKENNSSPAKNPEAKSYESPQKEGKENSEPQQDRLLSAENLEKWDSASKSNKKMSRKDLSINITNSAFEQEKANENTETQSESAFSTKSSSVPSIKVESYKDPSLSTPLSQLVNLISPKINSALMSIFAGGNEAKPQEKSSATNSTQATPRYQESLILSPKLSKVKIEDWLQQIKLEELKDVFIQNGYHEYDTLREEFAMSSSIFDDIVAKFGIEKPGHVDRIVMKIREDANLIQREGIFTYRKAFGDTTIGFPSLQGWLECLGHSRYIKNFVNSGYDNLEFLALQVNFQEKPLNEDILENIVGVYSERVRKEFLSRFRLIFETGCSMELEDFNTPKFFRMLVEQTTKNDQCSIF